MVTRPDVAPVRPIGRGWHLIGYMWDERTGEGRLRYERVPHPVTHWAQDADGFGYLVTWDGGRPTYRSKWSVVDRAVVSVDHPTLEHHCGWGERRASRALSPREDKERLRDYFHDLSESLRIAS